MLAHLQNKAGQSRNFTLRLRQISILFAVLIYLPFSLFAEERPSLSFSEKTFLQLKDALLSRMTDLSQTAANLNKKESEASVKSNGIFMMPCVDGTPGTIGGNVYNDLNYNGLNDEITIGFPNIKVYAFNCSPDGSSLLQDSTLTDANGDFTIGGLVDGDKYRMEFVVPNGLSNTKFNTGSKTSVQFTISPACDVDLGLANGADFCGSEEPNLIIPCYTNGDPLAAGAEMKYEKVIVRFNYLDGGLNPAPDSIANASEVGSVYGIAYQRGEKRLFASTFVKRHMGLGPMGIDGIYAIDLSDPAEVDPPVIEWLNTNTVGSTMEAFPSNSARMLPLVSGDPGNDVPGFDGVGKHGFGDIDVGAAENVLYAVSLTDTALYAIIIDGDGDFSTPPTAADVTKYTLPQPCTNGTFRPFATKVWRDEVYVGGVCDAEGGTAADLSAIVYKLEDNGTFTSVLEFPLDYEKGYPWSSNSCLPNSKWFPWSPNFPTPCNGTNIVRPTPILSDIEFDLNGAMILGFMDRTAQQVGWQNYDLTGQTDLYNSYSGGDILRAYLDANGDYQIEANASADNTTAGANTLGAGEGEYYFQEFFDGPNHLFSAAPPHSETAQGALAFLPGSGEVVSSSMDPYSTAFNSGGVNWFNNMNGTVRDPGYELFTSPLTGTNGTFGKAAGLGDLELLCNQAPIQIGNYVWLDVNNNGIQESCETPLENIYVGLYDLDGNLLDKDTTDVNGEYYFSSDETSLAGEIVSFTDYYVVFGIDGQYDIPTAKLNNIYDLTIPNIGQYPNFDKNDSDGLVATATEGNGVFESMPYMLVNTLAPGEFDHSYDIGFFAQPQITAIGDFAFKDCDTDGIQDDDEEGLEGVIVTLSGTDVNGMAVNKMTLTDTMGFYIFDTLVAGTYTVFFDYPAGSEGLSYGFKDSGMDDTKDSDVDELTGITDPITLADGERNLTVDAAFIDIEIPTAVGLVDPLILGCMDTIPEIEFVDNCADSVIIISSSSIVQSQDSCQMRTKRSWLISDGCGNINSICQTIVQRDDNPPVGTPAPDTIILCPADTLNLPIPTFVDDCDLYLDITMSSGIIPIDDCEYQIHRFFEATDNCGNAAEILQIVTVKDTAAVSVVSEPEPVDFECSLGVLQLPQVMNSCGEMIPLNADTTYISGDCDNRFTANIRYTSLNPCYNYDFTHVVNITSDTPPSLAVVTPTDITIECGDDIPALILEFTDDCGGLITQTPSSTTTELACGFTILQTVTANDMCGNEIMVTRTINVEDTTEPTLSGVPDNEVADCEGTANIPAPATVTATDTCDGDVPVEFTEIEQNMACEGAYMIIRTWTATDACGNSTSQSQTITVGDDGPPTITGVPTDITVECELPELPTVTAADNCGTVDLQFIESNPADTCSTYQVTRTWTATDDCGNISSESYTITVEITAPTPVDMPAILTYQCDETIPAAVTPAINEGCYPAAITDFTETNIPGDCPQEYSVTREWTVSDECGNEFTITQTVNVIDTVAPVLTILEPMLQGLMDGDSIYLECDAMISLNEDGATAVDNCDDDLEVMFMEMPGENADCAEDGYIAHMICGWKATDDCGNQVQILINFFIIDNTEPMLFGVPNDVDASCNYDLTPPNVGVMDNCDLDIEVEMTETETGEICNRIIVRKWTATDHCGNMVMQSQTLTLTDTEDPVLVDVPADAVVSCNQIPEVPLVTATDDCADDLIVSFAENIYGLTCDEQQLNRMWTVTDNCGNTTTAQQTITILDDTAPTLIGVPEDAMASCNNIPSAATVSANDDCDDDLEVIFSENIIGNTCDEYQILRTWTVTDDCGNTSADQQIITITDDVAPVLVGVPNDMTVQCDAIPAPPTVTADDDCDASIDVIYTENEVGNTCQTRQIIRTWAATDDCGNTVSASQTISIEDNIAPVLGSIPNDMTLECSNIPTAPNVTASDNCDENIDVVLEETISGNTCDEQQIIRTWTATDDCGNTSSASQTITLTDDNPPVLTGVPADVTTECSEIPLPAVVTASDDCDNILSIDFENIETEGECKDSYTITRTWSVTDDCGNTTEEQQIITVVDTQAPIITLINPLLDDYANGDTIFYQCDADIFDINDATAFDVCDAEPSLSFVELAIDDDPCHTILACTWTAEDICGNVSQFVIYIKIEDTTPPVFDNIPTNTMADCSNMPSGDDVTATDNCGGEVTIEIIENGSGTSCENLQITRLFVATDQCGNATVVSQTITVMDNESPVLVGVPDDIMLECHEDISPASVTATDDCDSNVEVIMTEEIIDGSCENEYTIIRTWTASDDCGNEVSATQTIMVKDITPPIFIDVPDDLDIECDALPNPPIMGDEIKAVDLCDTDVTITFEEETQGDDCSDFQLIRTWTATDNCGNMSMATQVISLSDNTPPTLTNIPQDTDYQCGAPIIDDLPTATDACDDDVEIIVEEGQVDLDCGYVILRIFTATDDCGNSSTASQTISVIDNTPPTISGVPSDLSLECEEEIPAPIDVITTDNCGEVTLSVDEMTQESPLCDNNFTIIRTYTATDDCGNTSTTTQTITVSDTTAPRLTFDTPQLMDLMSGDTLFLECNELFNVEAAAIITDNCDDNPNVIFEEETIVGTDCEADGYLVHLICTWELSDDCGNTSIFVLNIIISDNTPPVIFCPEDITIDLAAGESIPSADNVNIVDNCTDNIDLVINETEIPDADECGYTIIRTYTATDECGNTMICEQNITVEEFCECPDIIVTDTDNYPASCAGDDGIYDVTLEDAAAYDYVLIPNFGTSNDIGNTRTNLPVGDYLLVISQPEIDTCEMKLYFTIVDGCVDCDTDVFASSEIEIELLECDDLGRVCLTIEEESVLDYSIQMNGADYTGSLVGCTFDTTYNYATAAIPGWGMAGPYTITNWTVNGLDYSAEFNNLTELMNIMNDWDPTGNWTLSTGSITGGNTANDYGSMEVTQNNTGAIANLMRNIGTTAMGIAVTAPLGEHEFIFTHNQTGCANTANVSVYCSPEITPSISDLIIPRNSTKSFCLDLSELPGNVVSIESICEAESFNQYAYLTSFDTDYCLNISGLEIGEQNFCYQVCDDFGFCDTMYLNISVTEQIFTSAELPLAIADDYTINEGETIIIDVCLNDQINGVLESHSLRSLPQTGTAILRGNEIEYTPENDVCQDISFVYEICNDMGCDEAEVTIHYMCNDVIIFNGFSPNNDNVNDAFTILGLERYPNHSLQVFSRWGTKVFEAHDYQNDWKGTNAGKDLPDGTYFYLFNNGEGERLSGHVTIRR